MPNIISDIVEVCVFRRVNGVPQYLILRRAQKDQLYPNIWQLISGTLHADEHALQGAVREVKEEIGLTPFNFWVVPFMNSFYVAVTDTVHLSCLFAAEVSSDLEPTLSSEHQMFGWFSCEEAEPLLVWPGQRRSLRFVHEYIIGGTETARLSRVDPPVL